MSDVPDELLLRDQDAEIVRRCKDGRAFMDLLKKREDDRWMLHSLFGISIPELTRWGVVDLAVDPT